MENVMDKEFTSVAELDSFFENNKVEATKVEEAEEISTDMEVVEEIPVIEEEEIVEKDEEDEAQEDEEDDEVEDKKVGEPESKSKKPTKAEKQDYAFAEMRRKKGEAEKALEERDQLVQRLMKEAGYTDYESFKSALDKQFSEKEMKAKGYTQEQFDEVAKLKQQNEELQKKLLVTEQQEKVSKANSFDTLVKTYANDYKTTAKEIYEELDKTGFTVEMLLSLKNPEVLIRGILADKTKVVKPEKKAVDKTKLPSSTSSKGAFDIDELLKADFAEYTKRKGNS